MTKRLICLVLSLILLVGALAGCANKTDSEAASNIADKASESAATLSMYLMSEAPVSAETAAKIEAAVNEITQAKFKTKLKLYFYTEDVYYTKLQEAFDARAAAKANGTLMSSKSSSTADGEEETIVNEYGVVEIKYPEIASYQVDIFYLGGQDKYNEYRNADLLTRLDEELSSSSKELKKYIPNTLLERMKNVNNGTYALPTNQGIGEYTYLLLNKEALAEAYRNEADETKYAEKYTSLTSSDCVAFLNYVKDPNSKMNEKYYPLYTNLTQKELLFNNLYFWGVDEAGNLSDAFSVLGDYYTNGEDFKNLNNYPEIANLFENSQFLHDMEQLKRYEVEGYYTAEENKQFAVGYVQGGAELAEQYGDDYVMIPVAAPRLDEDDLFNDMFAVCKNTSSTSRSMKILTHLNTDETFRNLLLYGIKDEHYMLKDTEYKNELGEPYQVVQRLNTEYQMSVNRTGNTLIAYPTEDQLPIINEYHVNQNLDVKTKLTLGYTPTYDGKKNEYKVDTEGLQAIRTLSAEIWADYLACDTMAEYEDFLADAKAKVAASEAVQKHTHEDHGLDTDGKTTKACDGTCGSIQYSYSAWLKKNGMIK
ncbi:MAG: hypothetical protein IJW44_02290 [Clostridia bacterium]|nr:hypothetical protein [Clostridia bacterium]